MRTSANVLILTRVTNNGQAATRTWPAAAALRMVDQRSAAVRWGTRTPVTRAARPGIGSLSAGNIAASLTKIDGDRDQIHSAIEMQFLEY